MNLKTSKKKLKSALIKGGERPLLNLLEKELVRANTVLEIGFGKNSPLAKIKKHYYLEGIDIDIPKKNSQKTYDKYQKGDIKDLTGFYKKNSFEVVVALDVIEHLKKKEGIKLMKDLDWVASKKIIILTPNGFLKQGSIDGNKYQEHLSGWKTKDFKKFGYNCYGIHGLKFLRGEQAGIAMNPWYVWLLISNISQKFTYRFADFAFHILAIKIVLK